MAFTPVELASASIGIVVDVLRATSTIAQALASGYERVFCCSEVDEAVALRDSLGGGVLGGERSAVAIPGFDLGNSPSEYMERREATAILTTTNGTRAIVTAAAQCRRVVLGGLLNLDAAASAADAGEDVVIVCAGVEGALALDDAYCAGRIAELLDGDLADSAQAAVRIANSFPTAYDALRSSRSAANLLAKGLEGDIEWCSQVNALNVAPRLVGMRSSAAEITAGRHTDFRDRI